MDAKPNVPLTELKLPKSGDVVVMAEYLTTGQSRELQKILLQGGHFDVEEGKMKDIPVDMFLEMQDRAAELLIKQIKKQDGKTESFTTEWLYNLPVEDGNLVYERVNEITQASTLTPEEKKK